MSALVTSCLVGACVVGGGSDAGTTQDGFEVSSDPKAGLLARIDYDEGGLVEFLRNEEGGIFIGSVFERGGFDPLRGIRLDRVLPSELFTRLTNRQAPADLLAAEREAGLVASPAALEAREQLNGADDPARSGAEDLGTASLALTASDFSALYCYPGIHFCGLGVLGNLRVDSDGRVDSADGYVNVVAGSLRLRVTRKKIIGSDQTLGTYVVSAGGLLRFRNATPGIDRVMHVIVDQADTAVYHLSTHFPD
ncbi:hypothetical protein BE21_44645 [Sorangium cellulosum]|uniref:Uncharacterized protein n=1 Tax=Sorangium cellulosum TaxID=56 RepID=A0A150TJG5_SORCE|nr:hypothetical protein BE21_44645 [Sorangium cellulosum]